MEGLFTIFARPQEDRNVFRSLAIGVFMGYFVSSIQYLKASTAIYESVLYATYRLLSTENSRQFGLLLLLEFACILTVYGLVSIDWVGYIILGSLLMVWKCFYTLCPSEFTHHPKTFVNKCATLLFLRLILGIPEPVITLLYSLEVIYKYVFEYRRKSFHDTFLIVIIAAILFDAARSMDGNMYGIFIIYLSLLVLLWLIRKRGHYSLKQHTNNTRLSESEECS